MSSPWPSAENMQYEKHSLFFEGHLVIMDSKTNNAESGEMDMENVAGQDYQTNISWLFIPFRLESEVPCAKTIASLASSGWLPQKMANSYLLKYISDKYDSSDEENCCCFHFRLRDEMKEKTGISREGEWKGSKNWYYQGKLCEFRFHLQDAHLFFFRSGIGIIAFQVHTDSGEPKYISTLLFHLKRVSVIQIRADREGTEDTTLLDIARGLVGTLGSAGAPAFFEFLNPGEERANVLCYLELPPKADYSSELFYLRHCYGDSYRESRDEDAEKKEVLSLVSGFTWGISAEALVCIAAGTQEQKSFRESAFFSNFNQNYLLLYVLLLHQKAKLYHFLTKIGIGNSNSIKALEAYQQELYEFETDYVFSTVSEVPQYQIVYERVEEAFALRKLFDDVHYPLKYLSIVRQREIENTEAKRKKKTSTALATLSLLSLISAFQSVRSLLTENFEYSLCTPFLKGATIFAILLLMAALISLLIVFIARPVWQFISRKIKGQKHDKK